jgi:hypothetical protein
MWNYYLAYYERAFRERHISDVQLIFTNYSNSAILHGERMTRRIVCIAPVTAMISLSSAASELAVGGGLPELRIEYLSGREAIPPKDACGRVAPLLFGFTYQSRFAVEAWTKHFREEFERNRRVALRHAARNAEERSRKRD